MAPAPHHAGTDYTRAPANPTPPALGLAVQVVPLQDVAVALLIGAGEVVGNDGVAPPPKEVGADGSVSAGIMHACGVLGRTQDVRVDAVLQPLLLFGDAVVHELLPDVAVVELVGKARKDIRAADIDSSVEHIGPNVDLSVRDEE